MELVVSGRIIGVGKNVRRGAAGEAALATALQSVKGRTPAQAIKSSACAKPDVAREAALATAIQTVKGRNPAQATESSAIADTISNGDGKEFSTAAADDDTATTLGLCVVTAPNMSGAEKELLRRISASCAANKTVSTPELHARRSMRGDDRWMVDVILRNTLEWHVLSTAHGKRRSIAGEKALNKAIIAYASFVSTTTGKPAGTGGVGSGGIGSSGGANADGAVPGERITSVDASHYHLHPPLVQQPAPAAATGINSSWRQDSLASMTSPRDAVDVSLLPLNHCSTGHGMENDADNLSSPLHPAVGGMELRRRYDMDGGGDGNGELYEVIENESMDIGHGYLQANGSSHGDGGGQQMPLQSPWPESGPDDAGGHSSSAHVEPGMTGATVTTDASRPPLLQLHQPSPYPFDGGQVGTEQHRGGAGGGGSSDGDGIGGSGGGGKGRCPHPLKDGCSLYVRNVPSDCTHQMLFDLFTTAGNIRHDDAYGACINIQRMKNQPKRQLSL